MKPENSYLLQPDGGNALQPDGGNALQLQSKKLAPPLFRLQPYGLGALRLDLSNGRRSIRHGYFIKPAMSGANTHLRWQPGDKVHYPEIYMSYPDNPDRYHFDESKIK